MMLANELNIILTYLASWILDCQLTGAYVAVLGQTRKEGKKNDNH